ncbi:transcriptional regulator with XRE-family HTH domain [Limimaricola variabilis]|jgi:transcriptional regulator with XRE-family HTH domain|uniref:Transcriptional regulator with XRE-family HTH domain n=1 Tax=Limimaricola variabilis TaxID=1492771 RepID=A0ABR6HL07_9RHOB|nr:helix-turn-helix transcriptional regulator [Limimaricola variabilis]MBB3711148.1 transcriptional regulator with XRE-family HTH domain [Limimaricola variabilis]WPY93866.1 helix-turn-helix domain-containing protein [Limimaricola variabilis]
MSVMDEVRSGLGTDLRRLRKSKGLRIADLAALTNRSTGWISQVERGRSRLDYEDLKILAQAFELPLSQLFRRDGAVLAPEDTVLRADQRRALSADNSGAMDDLLTPMMAGIHFYSSELAPHTASERPRHEGDIMMGLVVKGDVQIRIGDRHHHLGAGDSFWSRGEAFSWLNPHDTPCTVVWVLAPLPDDPDA